MKTTSIWIAALALAANTAHAEAPFVADAPPDAVAIVAVDGLPTEPVLARGPGLGVRYQFLGAVTQADQVLTSVHCSEIGGAQPATIEIQIFDFFTQQVGAGMLTVPPLNTRTATVHAMAMTADTAFYEEDLLIPVLNDVNQGVVQVFSDSRSITCSAQKLDAVNGSPLFIEALAARMLFTPENSAAGDVFTGVRISSALSEVAVHCSPKLNQTVLEVSIFDSTGTAVATSGLFVVTPGVTHTVASADVAFYREDLLADPPGAVAQGMVRVSGTVADCTAHLVRPVGMVPQFLVALGGTTAVPELGVFNDGFESGNTSAWTATVP